MVIYGMLQILMKSEGFLQEESGYLGQSKTKVSLGFPRPVNQRHKNFPLHTPNLTHRLFEPKSSLLNL
jgi:hypothetical protein